MTRIRDNVFIRQTRLHVSRTLAGTIAYLVEEDTALLVFDSRGTPLIENAWPAPGTKYVGSGKSRERLPRTLRVSEMS